MTDAKTDRPTDSARLEEVSLSLQNLSFCESNASSVSDWVANLPLTNINETASQLRNATSELAQLNLEGGAKYGCLEAVRPALHYVCSRLDRSRSADLDSRELLENLCTGYKGVIQTLMPGSEKQKSADREVLSKGLHRLLSDMSRILLRALQNYTQPPQNFWWELNELFRLAEAMELTQFRMDDDENHAGQALTIEETYIRSLLLVTCKANQLQKSDINIIFSALELWAEHVVLSHDIKDALLTVDLLANRGPAYQASKSDKGELRALRTEVLAYEIEAYLKNVSTNISIPDTLSDSLLEHLIAAWTLVQERNFGRQRSDASLRFCAGLSAAHFFLSGGVDFTAQLSSPDALLRREVNPFLDVTYGNADERRDSDDPWSQTGDGGIKIPENPNVEAPEMILLEQNRVERPAVVYEHLEARAVDTSPSGYQIQWLDDGSQKMIVGDLIALREEKDQRWCIAVIRWMSNDRGITRMGVQLLAPKAIPVAVRTIQKKGGPSDYARGLLLPELRALKQEATLITPKVPFATGHKVHVHRQGLQTTAQLLKTKEKTESFNQFTFRMLDGYLET